jgi:tRNA pseudouridine32 synthase/23S rRNA pseudouridine746 synthase
MLLHASRLVVPRGKRPAVDVKAPLPEHWGEWASLVAPVVPNSTETTRAAGDDEA